MIIPHDKSPQRLYGRRKGRPLKAKRVTLMETLLPRVVVTIPTNTKLCPLTMFAFPLTLVPRGRAALDPALRRGDDNGKCGTSLQSIALEIGFGGGEHLAAQAAAHPDVGFIGCEPFVNGVAKLLTQIDEQGLKNVRIYPDDARTLMDALPDSCLDMCFVLYADPWPKTRHAERRFIGKENLDRLARIMMAGGELRLATDVAGLAQWMREQVNAHLSFVCLYDGPQAPADWVPTRYEQKGIAAGRTPVYLVYKKVCGVRNN